MVKTNLVFTEKTYLKSKQKTNIISTSPNLIYLNKKSRLRLKLDKSKRLINKLKIEYEQFEILIEILIGIIIVRNSIEVIMSLFIKRFIFFEEALDI